MTHFLMLRSIKQQKTEFQNSYLFIIRIKLTTILPTCEQHPKYNDHNCLTKFRKHNSIQAVSKES